MLLKLLNELLELQVLSFLLQQSFAEQILLVDENVGVGGRFDLVGDRVDLRDLLAKRVNLVNIKKCVQGGNVFGLIISIDHK